MKKALTVVLVFLLALTALPVQAANDTAFAKRESYLTGTISLEAMHVSNLSEDNLKAMETSFNLADTQINSLEKNGEANSLSLDFEIAKPEGGQADCSAAGSVNINGVEQKFSVYGRLYLYNSENGDQIFTGGLAGYTDGSDIFASDEVISLSVNYNASTGNAFIPVALGSFGDEEHHPAMVEFGEQFVGLTEAIDTMIATMNKPVQSASEVVDEDLTIQRAPNLTEYCLATGAGAYNGRTVIYHSYYGTKEAAPSGSWLAKIRTQVHLNNFISAYNASLPPYDPDNPYQVYTSISHCVTDVWLNFGTNKTNNRIVDPKPDAFSSSITLKYPTFIIPYGALNYLMSYVSLSIPTNGVSHAYNANYNTLQTKVWAGGGMAQAVTTSSSPYTTTSGVANNFLVFNSISAGTTCTATTNGSAQIFLEDVRGDGTTVPRWIVVSSGQKTSTLSSVS